MSMPEMALAHPDRAAMIIEPGGDTLTYAELDRQRRRIAAYLVAQGLKQGDTVALCMENRLAWAPIIWACLLHGFHFVPVAAHLREMERDYIVRDCGAKAIFTSDKARSGFIDDTLEVCSVRVIDGTEQPNFVSYASILSMAGLPEAAEAGGALMPYSSGTTGHPKGVRSTLLPRFDPNAPHFQGFAQIYRFGSGDVYFSPAPLYHAMPLANLVSVGIFGGTAVSATRFDAEAALHIIEKHSVTAASMVPTMFVRMLQLPPETRKRYDLGTIRTAVHAGAPCPISIKRAMIDWWGPVLMEFYSGSEAVGCCAIDSQDWLDHPGSVGRAILGTLHILDDDGNELPPGAIGGIYFESAHRFQYHNAPEKTEGAYSRQGWATFGDIGYVDEDGYLYLTDRKSFMIISGGVNIYPQEIENALITHPAVRDVAVIGVPDSEFGEQVKAVVELRPDFEASTDLEQDIIAFAKTVISRVKAPRSVDFVDQLPREDNGKLYKAKLKQLYGERALA